MIFRCLPSGSGERARIDAAFSEVEGRAVEIGFGEGGLQVGENRRRKARRPAEDVRQRERKSCLDPSGRLSCPTRLLIRARIRGTCWRWRWRGLEGWAGFERAVDEHAAGGVGGLATGLSTLDHENRGAAFAQGDGEGEADDPSADDDYVPGLHSGIVAETAAGRWYATGYGGQSAKGDDRRLEVHRMADMKKILIPGAVLGS